MRPGAWMVHISSGTHTLNARCVRPLGRHHDGTVAGATVNPPKRLEDLMGEIGQHRWGASGTVAR